jgi:hypothetical protein
MTSPVFVTPSAENGLYGHLNLPVNLSYCNCLSKESYILSKGSFRTLAYLICFEGCVDTNDETRCWSYPTEQERDADYDRILNAFAATTPNS